MLTTVDPTRGAILQLQWQIDTLLIKRDPEAHPIHLHDAVPRGTKPVLTATLTYSDPDHLLTQDTANQAVEKDHGTTVEVKDGHIRLFSSMAIGAEEDGLKLIQKFISNLMLILQTRARRAIQPVPTEPEDARPRTRATSSPDRQFSNSRKDSKDSYRHVPAGRGRGRR